MNLTLKYIVYVRKTLLCIIKLTSDSEFIRYHLCNNKFTKHLTVILLHGTKAHGKLW